MTKPFHCKNCYHTLGYRDCDKLIVDAIEIEFKRSHQVKCKECGCETAFRVTAKKDSKGVDTVTGSVV